MTKTTSTLAVALSALLLGACAADVSSDEGVATTGGEGAALHAPPAERPDRLERRLARAKVRLDLTDAQVEQLRPILERMRAERRALRDLAPEERREAAQALRERVRAELEPILTPEQLAEAERMLVRNRGRHGRGGRHGRHGAGGFRGPPDPDRAVARMKQHLDLTDEQATQVRPILERAHERRAALRDLPREERPEARRALHEQVRGELAQILTEDQLERHDAHFEQRRQHRRGRRHGGAPPATAP